MTCEIDSASDSFHRALRKRDRNAAVRHVMRAANEAMLVRGEQKIDQRLFAIERNLRRLDRRTRDEHLLPLRAAHLVARVAEEDDIEAGFGEVQIGADVFAIENAHHPHCRRRINRPSLGLVVEGNIARHDWRTERHACVADSTNTLGKLPHDLRPLR